MNNKNNKFRQAVFVVIYRKNNLTKNFDFLLLKRKKHWIGWEFTKGGVESTFTLSIRAGSPLSPAAEVPSESRQRPLLSIALTFIFQLTSNNRSTIEEVEDGSILFFNTSKLSPSH